MNTGMQEGSFAEVDKIGKRLSLVLDCAIRWTGFDKNVFVCKHGLLFSVQRLKSSDDWSWATEEHKKVE